MTTQEQDDAYDRELFRRAAEGENLSPHEWDRLARDRRPPVDDELAHFRQQFDAAPNRITLVPSWPPPAGTSGYAVAALVLGIAGALLFCTVIPSLLAIVFGHLALEQTGATGRPGRGQAITGLVLGYVVAVPACAWILYVVTFQ